MNAVVLAQVVAPATSVSMGQVTPVTTAEMERRRRGCRYGPRKNGRCPSRRRR